MKILSDKYDAADIELHKLGKCFAKVEAQAKAFGLALEQVTDGNEVDLLVKKVGRLAKQHAKNMEKL